MHAFSLSGICHQLHNVLTIVKTWLTYFINFELYSSINDQTKSDRVAYSRLIFINFDFDV